MRYIKVLSLFVILAVALLLISTIRTYATGISGPAAAIIVCDGDLVVIKAAITDTSYGCDTGSGDDCATGAPCEDCLEACLDAGYFEMEHSGIGKITYTLTSE